MFMTNGRDKKDRVSRKVLQERWSHLFQGSRITTSFNVATSEVSGCEGYDESETDMKDYEQIDIPTSEKECSNNDSHSETSDEEWEEDQLNESFGRDDALNLITAVFLANRISTNLGKDIFDVGHLLGKYSDIKIDEVWKRVQEWVNHETRVYYHCTSCGILLADVRKCTNKKCNRFMVSQASVPSSKIILTFSLREQVQDLLDKGKFDRRLLNRLETNSMLCGRVSDTPKYKERVRRCEAEYPEMITLLLTLNTDGFRKRGQSRGEVWPVFIVANDIVSPKRTFQQYRPEMAMLTSLMLADCKLKSNDFSALFERMRQEIEDSSYNPLTVTFDGISYKVRLELYHSALDMDASRKIHGLPVWQSYGSCSRCDVEGTRSKTRKASKISWYTQKRVRLYNGHERPAKFIESCLTPPWNDAYDGLHLICEGTSRDIMKDLLGNGEKIYAKISQSERNSWARAMEQASVPKGRTTSNLIDPIQLSSRTGREIQELYELSIPTLIVMMETKELWMILLYLHWLITRLLTDPLLSEENCSALDQIVPTFRSFVGSVYPQLYTLKFHFVVDHLAADVRVCGSPMLSSTAPFERLNQTLGRSTNCYTTRTVVDMSSKFMALQRAMYHCEVAQTKRDGSDFFPRTLESISENNLIKRRRLHRIDNTDLSQEERDALVSKMGSIKQFEQTAVHRDVSYSVRWKTENNVTRDCFVYYTSEDKLVSFGSIERIFKDDGGALYTLLLKFDVVDPISAILQWPQIDNRLRSVFQPCKIHNNYFFQIVGTQYEIVPITHLKGYTVLLEFNSKSYVSRC